MCVNYDIVNRRIFQWSLALILSTHVRGLTAEWTEPTTLPTAARLQRFRPKRKLYGEQFTQERAYGSAASPATPGCSSYLCGPADLEQVEPVGVPVVDDVGQFPPLLLPAPRHGGHCSRPSPLR